MEKVSARAHFETGNGAQIQHAAMIEAGHVAVVLVVVAPQLHAGRQCDEQMLESRKSFEAIPQQGFRVFEMLQNVEHQERADATAKVGGQRQGIGSVVEIAGLTRILGLIGREIAAVAIYLLAAKMRDRDTRPTTDIEHDASPGLFRQFAVEDSVSALKPRMRTDAVGIRLIALFARKAQWRRRVGISVLHVYDSAASSAKRPKVYPPALVRVVPLQVSERVVSIGKRTVGDFGEQWEHFGDFDGFYGSLELLQDTFGPLLEVEELRGLRTADIGAGTGRSTLMMIQAGAKSVVAVEPSSGVEQLRINTEHIRDQVEVIHGPGESLPADANLDFIFSYGVIQFIPDPMPVLRAARAALRPGGRACIWVYGREGNELYLMLLKLLRSVSTALPHAALSALCSTLNVLLTGYIALCRALPLPLYRYMRNTLGGYDSAHRKIVIYDQLNPTHVVYHTRDQAKALLEDAGFEDVQLYHRHGYSWTVMGSRPAEISS